MKSLSLGALEKYVRIKVAFGPPVDGMGPSASGQFNGGHGGGRVHSRIHASFLSIQGFTPNFLSINAEFFVSSHIHVIFSAQRF